MSERHRSAYLPVRSVNAAADRRKMRSIIAEDSEWTLAGVPLLTTLCLQQIVKNFEGKLSRDDVQ